MREKMEDVSEDDLTNMTSAVRYFQIVFFIPFDQSIFPEAGKDRKQFTGSLAEFD